MKNSNEIDDPRRRLLIQALASGIFAAGLPGSNALAASIFGSKPAKLPSDKSIYRLSGQVAVNGKDAKLDTPIKTGDVVTTGKNSEVIFVVNGNNSMILRGDSHLVISSDKKKNIPQKTEAKKNEPRNTERKVTEPESPSFISGLSLLAGKLLSVSRNTPIRVNTPTATIGIRGTGFYVTADPEQTYFCTCYGLTDVTSNFNPNSKETIKADHHDKPVYIIKDSSGNNIRKAPLIDHTDQELTLIEALVGRTTPFVFAKDEYSAPRRDY